MVHQEVRSRYRHLGHLPLTCEFALCELDLRPPTVSQFTLNQFAGERRVGVDTGYECGVCSCLTHRELAEEEAEETQEEA